MKQRIKKKIVILNYDASTNIIEIIIIINIPFVTLSSLVLTNLFVERVFFLTSKNKTNIILLKY